MTLERIIDLSNSANTPSIWNSMRPEGVESLLMQEEVNPASLKFTQKADEIRQRPPQAIDTPRRHEVDLPPRHRLQEGVEPRPAVPPLRAADTLIAEDRHDGPVEASGHLMKVEKLVLGGLAVRGRDAEVKGNTLHPFSLKRVVNPSNILKSRTGIGLLEWTKEEPMPSAGTHIIRVVLQDEPSIYRDIEVESRRSLSDLAEAVVHAFDFEFDHAFGFYSKLTGPDVMRSTPKYELFADMGEETTAKSVRKTPVADAFPSVGHTMLFMFDYGDDWRFVVEVIGLGQKAAKIRYPKVLKKVGEAPEQYGAWDDDDADDEDDES